MDATVLRAEELVDDETRVLRLAELVQHITECPPTGALHAVRRVIDKPPADADESLDVVARAIVAVKRGGIDLRDDIKLD